MIHERFDLDKWVKAFPLAKLNKDTDLAAALTGPLPVAYVEQIRTAVKKTGGDLGKPVAVDLCIWKVGDTNKREVTKIGGVPYWPATEPWPMVSRKKPYTFVAQFCFADSKDILGKLPGDILSVLAAGSDYQDLELRWFKLDEQKLLSVDKLPEAKWMIHPCHAVLHRTAEYPKADYDLFEKYSYPLCLWAMRFKNCSKIGRTWEMRGELPDLAEIEDAELRRSIQKSWDKVREQEKTFFCQLGSIQATQRQPFINVDRFEDLARSHAEKFLMISDVGGFDFFHNGKETSSSWWS